MAGSGVQRQPAWAAHCVAHRSQSVWQATLPEPMICGVWRGAAKWSGGGTAAAGGDRGAAEVRPSAVPHLPGFADPRRLCAAAKGGRSGPWRCGGWAEVLVGELVEAVAGGLASVCGALAGQEYKEFQRGPILMPFHRTSNFVSASSRGPDVLGSVNRRSHSCLGGRRPSEGASLVGESTGRRRVPHLQ